MKDNVKIENRNDSLLISCKKVELVDVKENTYIIKDSSANMLLGRRGAKKSVILKV